jgi:WS/DGAT/MGAT family acyltransferase
MSGVDTAWLRMDTPHNRMVIVGVMIFGSRLSPKRFRGILTERFLRFDRFRRRPVLEDGGAWWEEDPDFDLSRHLHRAALPGKGGVAELQAFTSELASSPLDPGKPLWEFHLVERYGKGSALVLRIHHCYADGIALIRVLLAMADDSPRDEGRAGGGAPWWLPFTTAWLDWLTPANGASAALVRWSAAFWRRYFELLGNPAKALDYARKGTGIALEAGRLLAMAKEPETRLRGEPGPVKRAAWAEPIPLAEVKTLGKQLACSVNDVLLASAAGALRAYLQHHGDDPDGIDVRVVVPVNLRPPDEAEELGNKFGLVFLQLPVGIPSPLERLFTVKQRMQALKTSAQPLLVLGLLEAAGSAPQLVQQFLVDTLSSHASAVMTNVPGPQRALHVAGAQITEQMFWVPQAGNIGIGASILSYDGRVQFGLIADAKIMPDPDWVAKRFAREFQVLQKAARADSAADAAPKTPRRRNQPAAPTGAPAAGTAAKKRSRRKASAAAPAAEAPLPAPLTRRRRPAARKRAAGTS